MKLYVILLFVVLASVGACADDFVVVCRVDGMIDDGIRVFVERAIEDAEGAQAIIFEVDTPGGRVDSAIEISNAIVGSPVRTIAFIRGMGAISAGALISYSCDEIIMSPESNIGAATPVMATPEGMMPTGEKEVSYMRARMRALAERTDRNPALAEAMVDRDIALHAFTDAAGQLQIYAVYGDGSRRLPEESPASELPDINPVDIVRRVIDLRVDAGVFAQVDGGDAAEPRDDAGFQPEDEVILPAGKLLTLTAGEALRYELIPAITENLDAVLAHYGYADVEVRILEMTAAERIFRWLTSPIVSGLLLMLGIGGVYLEIRTPGFGVPGIIGIICLSLFFGAHLVLGIASWVDILLVVIGLALIGVELFVLPGFGVVGAAGIISLLVGLYMTLTTVPIPQYSWEYDRMSDAVTSLLIATLSFGVLIYALWRVLPRTALYGRLVLSHEQLQNQGYVVQMPTEQAASLGERGVAVSMLRPVGRGRFGDKTIQVVSRSDFIEAGTPIQIVQLDGNRCVVDRVEE